MSKSKNACIYRIFDPVEGRYVAGNTPILYSDNNDSMWIVRGNCLKTFRAKKLEKIVHRLELHEYPLYLGGTVKVTKFSEIASLDR